MGQSSDGMKRLDLTWSEDEWLFITDEDSWVLFDCNDDDDDAMVIGGGRGFCVVDEGRGERIDFANDGKIYAEWILGIDLTIDFLNMRNKIKKFFIFN